MQDRSSQQVKRMLSRDCIFVHFSWFGPEQTVWCEKEPKRLKIAPMYNCLPLVRTKASELSDFPAVNTPYECHLLLPCLSKSALLLKHSQKGTCEFIV